jgi:hypothetical protein
VITIKSIRTSCGISIPFFELQGERNDLNDWASERGKEGVQNYWENKTSIDGLPTHLLK